MDWFRFDKIVSIQLMLLIFNSFMKEVCSMICSANQWTGLYMIETSVMKELKKGPASCFFVKNRTTYAIHNNFADIKKLSNAKLYFV